VAVASVSDVTRFIRFVLAISLSFKDVGENTAYDWQAAFWPCWCFEGLLVLAAASLIPLFMVSALGQQERLLMLTWAALTTVGLAVATFLSITSLIEILDKRLCTDSCQSSFVCLHKLQRIFWPWLVFLPNFAFGTLLSRRKLVAELHAAWYQPARQPAWAGAGMEAGLGRRTGGARQELLPIPQVLFRITATYYSRTIDAAMLTQMEGGDVHRSPIPMSSWASSQGRMFHDPLVSSLAARGSTFEDIVESEQLCFVCYDRSPEAVLLECGHAGLCEICALQVMDRQCPICRAAISRVMRLCADRPLPGGLFTPSVIGSAGSLGPSSLGLLNEGSTTTLQAAPLIASSEDAPMPAARMAPSENSSVVQGPPWPAAAKRHAVAVQLVERPQPRAERWWWQ